MEKMYITACNHPVEVVVSGNSLEAMIAEVSSMPFSQRVRLLEVLVDSLKAEQQPGESSSKDFDNAFGLWKNREVSLADIRAKAWERK